MYLSTDYVFDGKKKEPYKESDEPNPINSYGRSKLEGERLALRQCPSTLVVRTSWLYGTHGKNFVATIMQLAPERPQLRVVADQRGCPTYAKDLAQAVAALVYKNMKGVVHAVGAGDCSWYEFAREIVSQMDLRTPVVPITTAEAKRVAPRPTYSVLANQVLAEAGITLPHWKDALSRFMKDREKVESEAKVETR